ncbi:FMN-binding negative transcriptional regulator [Mycetohabitans sp. B5]|uniref:Putative FMN-binding protein n=1 Tax=Mycetohabitans endofungorum TaxID=417203 RepID=A0A2P5KAK8_9BURK|nr:FMN-binding negative transcriptional regulator [Mycetohabitans sp. B5]PPB83744.1 putative FMN-binding protein [Mycetohabitans endofungorum]
MFLHHHSKKCVDVLHRLIAKPAWGTLVTLSGNGPEAPTPYLSKSMPAQNGSTRRSAPSHTPIRDARTDSDTLALLQGSSAYVSPDWYPSKQQAHRAATACDSHRPATYAAMHA